MDMQLAPAPLVTDPRRRLILFFFLMTAMFMATLDNQIVSTALPTIVGEFGHPDRFGCSQQRSKITRISHTVEN